MNQRSLDGNSGVFFRSTFEGTKVSGWQVEVAPKGKDTGGIYESYGRGWLEKIPDNKKTILAHSRWNKLRVQGLEVGFWEEIYFKKRSNYIYPERSGGNTGWSGLGH